MTLEVLAAEAPIAEHRGCDGVRESIVAVGAELEKQMAVVEVDSELGKLLQYPSVGHDAEGLGKHMNIVAEQGSDSFESLLVVVEFVVEAGMKLQVPEIDTDSQISGVVMGMQMVRAIGRGFAVVVIVVAAALWQEEQKDSGRSLKDPRFLVLGVSGSLPAKRL